MVIKVEFTELSLQYNRYKNQKEKVELLKNKVIKKIERRGKFLIWWFDKSPVLNHLGMTGTWFIENKNTSLTKYVKVIIDFEENIRASFDDMRNFGNFRIFRNEKELLEEVESLRTLGIDGLANPFPQAEFQELLLLKRNLNKRLGEILLDQRLVAGVGNIYKSEALFHAQLHPLTKIEELTKKEKIRLGESISFILNKALEAGGSSIENFQSPSGAGKAQIWHQVYSREKQECFICKTKIIRIVQKTRSTFFCPKCQPYTGDEKVDDFLPKKKEVSKKVKKTKKKQSRKK